MTQVLTITLNPAVDISSETEIVRPTRKTRTSNVRYDPGGGGINVARIIAALGGRVEAFYLAGGETGTMLQRLLAEAGIDARRFPVAGQTRIGVMVRETGTNLEYRFVPEGPVIGSQELESCIDAAAAHDARYVVASGSLPPGAADDIYVRLAHRAAARGARFVLDSSGPGLRITLDRAKVFLVKPSLGELSQLVDRKLAPDDAAGAAEEVLARGTVDYLAVTMGADGALLASRAGVTRLPATHVRVKSAVGAGDSFLGAMVWALAGGETPDTAFRYGLAAGAAAVTTPGARACTAQQILDLYRRYPGG